MKKIEIHLAIPLLSVIPTSCQLLRFSLSTSSRNFMYNINLTRFDNLAATFDLCRT